MHHPYHRTPPISGKRSPTLLRAFPHNIHPFSRELFPLDHLSREHYGDPYSLSCTFFLFSFGLGKHVYVFYHYPRGAYPLFSEVYSTLGNHVPLTKIPQISGDLFKIHPYQDKRSTCPLCRLFAEKMGIRMRPFGAGRRGGGGAAIKSSLYSVVFIWINGLPQNTTWKAFPDTILHPSVAKIK